MLLAGAHVPAEVQALVRDKIIANKAEIIAGITAHEENGKYLGMDLVTIEDASYDIVRSMYTTAGYPQFDKFLGE
jgi:phosphonate transport system substrate-binding protein